jgi:glycerophosphoryl diester phosphodiesterase
MTRPLIIAHRGASACAPENTLAAIEAAIEAGAEGVEFDVQLAKDVVPVVIHDPTLLRTAGRNERISTLTSAQLSKIDVGSWFNRKFSKCARPEFAKQTVPTLKRLLSLLKDFRGLIYVELKADEENFRELSSAVCEIIRDSPQLPQIIVKSFKLGAIPEVKHLLPEVQTAALFAPEIMHYLRRREHLIAISREFGADQISLHRSLVTPRLCSLAAQSQMPLTVWTVNDPQWLFRRKKLKIRALITNDPERFLQPA